MGVIVRGVLGVRERERVRDRGDGVPGLFFLIVCFLLELDGLFLPVVVGVPVGVGVRFLLWSDMIINIFIYTIAQDSHPTIAKYTSNPKLKPKTQTKKHQKSGKIETFFDIQINPI